MRGGDFVATPRSAENLPHDEASQAARHLRDLCVTLLDKDPRSRLGGRSVLNHPFFQHRGLRALHGVPLEENFVDGLSRHFCDLKTKPPVVPKNESGDTLFFFPSARADTRVQPGMLPFYEAATVYTNEDSVTAVPANQVKRCDAVSNASIHCCLRDVRDDHYIGFTYEQSQRFL